MSDKCTGCWESNKTNAKFCSGCWKKLIIKSEIPKMLDDKDIDLESIKNFAKWIVEEIVSWEYHEDNDNKHYAYETIMVAVYWEDYFKWENKNT